jgi:catalase
LAPWRFASMTEPAMGLEDGAKRHEIQQRMLKHWYKVHPDFGAAVEKGIGGAAQGKIAAE